ncbi:hypothetical protein DZC73_17750 [Albitalea terrae]|uniref:Uncharacterized protein n=2 Tax=Piscinibacter terrae TaxID=2496871 RepID=A0A3N7JVR4_9BURK|nr:hypothetical protein DZC73_17750 [Albitalea terrae]
MKQVWHDAVRRRGPGPLESLASLGVGFVLPLMLFAVVAFAAGTDGTAAMAGIAVGCLILGLFALFGNVVEWPRALRAMSAALTLALATALLVGTWQHGRGEAARAAASHAGAAAAAASAPVADAGKEGSAFDAGNAIAAVLAVVLAVTTLLATKTATDARDEIRTLMNQLAGERESKIHRWVIQSRAARVRATLLASRIDSQSQAEAVLPDDHLLYRAADGVLRGAERICSCVESLDQRDFDPEATLQMLENCKLEAHKAMEMVRGADSEDKATLRHLLRPAGLDQLADLIDEGIDVMPPGGAGRAASTEQLCAAMRQYALRLRQLVDVL